MKICEREKKKEAEPEIFFCVIYVNKEEIRHEGNFFLILADILVIYKK